MHKHQFTRHCQTTFRFSSHIERSVTLIEIGIPYCMVNFLMVHITGVQSNSH